MESRTSNLTLYVQNDEPRKQNCLLMTRTPDNTETNPIRSRKFTELNATENYYDQVILLISSLPTSRQYLSSFSVVTVQKVLFRTFFYEQKSSTFSIFPARQLHLMVKTLPLWMKQSIPL